MLLNCTTLSIMNKTTKSKQNAQSEMYDYDFKTKIKCTTVQTDAARRGATRQTSQSEKVAECIDVASVASVDDGADSVCCCWSPMCR